MIHLNSYRLLLVKDVFDVYNSDPLDLLLDVLFYGSVGFMFCDIYMVKFYIA